MSRSGCEGLAIVEAMDEREEALRHRDRAARNPRPSRTDRRPRHAGPRARRARDGGTRPLGPRASRIPPAFRSPTRRPDASRGLPPKRRRTICGPCGCWRCSRIRWCASACRARPWSMRRACSRSACCAGPRRRWASTGMRAALASRRAEEDRRAPRPRKRLTEADWDLADALLERLGIAFDTFTPAAHGEGKLDLDGSGGASSPGRRAALDRGRRCTGRAGRRCLAGSARGALRRSGAFRHPRRGRPSPCGPLRRLSDLLHRARQAADH